MIRPSMAGAGRRLRGRAPLLGWSLLVLALGAFVTPEVVLRVARARATACVARAAAPRGAELPDCGHLVDDFELPAKVSYTRHDATYRAEELYARVAMNRYLDAAVGAPDPDRLHRTSFGLMRAQEVVEKGSRRISLDDLGPTAPAPHLGKLAVSIGDRSALTRQPEYYGHWDVRLAALESALLEGDVELATDLAERYAAWDPRDADLRTATAAILCITHPRRGLDLLARVPIDRADKRYANIQRNFGEVLAVQEACAAKVGERPPAPPPASGAGEADAPEARLTTGLRLAGEGPEKDALLDRALARLQAEGEAGVSASVPFARLALLAAVLARSETLDPTVAANLATPRGGETSLAPEGLTLALLLGESPGLHPRVPVALAERASDRARAMSTSAEPASVAATLSSAATDLATLGAVEAARAGDSATASRLAELAAQRGRLSARAAALSVASALYVAGDAAAALRRLEPAPPAPDPDEPPLLSLELTTLEALLRASTGELDAARALAATLPSLADQHGGTQAALDARWVAVALGEAEAREGATLSWLGMADPGLRQLAVSDEVVAATLGAWSGALAGSSEDRRAFRYRILELRGDAPALLLPYLVASARLLDDDVTGAGVETWLDAASAIDARRVRMRSYAWARAEAARVRGDEAHADLWTERLRALRALASDDHDLEIASFLRL